MQISTFNQEKKNAAMVHVARWVICSEEDPDQVQRVAAFGLLGQVRSNQAGWPQHARDQFERELSAAVAKIRRG